MTNEYNPDGKEIRFIDSYYNVIRKIICFLFFIFQSN